MRGPPYTDVWRMIPCSAHPSRGVLPVHIGNVRSGVQRVPTLTSYEMSSLF